MLVGRNSERKIGNIRKLKKLKQYLQEIITQEWFISLNEIVKFFDETDSDDVKIQKLIEYATSKYINYKTKTFDFKKFNSVLESYKKMENTNFDSENHYLSFDYTDVLWGRDNNAGLYMVGRAIIVKNGRYTSYYIKKAANMRNLPSIKMFEGGTEDELRFDLMYNAIIAGYIGELLGVPTAKYCIVKYQNGPLGIGSESFLKCEQKLVTFQEIIDYYKKNNSDYQEAKVDNEDPKTYTAYLLDALAFYLKDKYKLSDEKMEEFVSAFLKQETFARIINLSDGKAENSAIIIEIDDAGNETVVSISPAFDLDFSLFMGRSIDDFWQRGLISRDENDNRSELEFFIKTIDSLCNREGELYDKQGEVKRFIESNLPSFQNPQNFCKQLFETIAKDGIVIPNGTKTRTIKYIDETFREISLIYDSMRNQEKCVILSDSLSLSEYN